LPKEWIKRRRRDYYYRKAKEEKYRSRASYKLIEAAERYNFIRPGDVVVDLGAAPGGWLQVSREIVGERGFVLGVDLNEIKPLNYPNVHTITGDIRDPNIVQRILMLLPRLADVVVSDVSPNISGIWEYDHGRQMELAQMTLKIAASILRERGNLFVKVFQGDMLNAFLRDVKRLFSVVRFVKPKASRPESAEIYILALGFKGQRPKSLKTSNPSES
jgi:23S rRNA (uridine2552-2'-O)-methyltransferase